MMYISATGGKKKERAIVEEVVAFCIKRLLPRAKKLEIEIELKNKLDAYGYCMMEGTNREFTITLRRDQTLLELIQTTCHEMVHVKQYYTKDLGEYGPKGTRWKSKYYKKYGSYPPWENEAYGMEKKLSYEFLEQCEWRV